jgi:lipoyl(octanoyl) transferase
MQLEKINVWRDEAFREASLEMALDHALLDHCIQEGEAIARLYAWNVPAITVGYFQKVDEEAKNPSPVRRCTGGGLVEHGEDITFALIFPSGSAAANAPSSTRYRWIHMELSAALKRSGFETTRHEDAFQNGERPCFQHAVSEDLIDPATGIKICGGAQRRSKGAVIHQGSIRLPKSLRRIFAPWTECFINALSARQSPLNEEEKANFMTQATRLQSERYGTKSWNQRGPEKG